MNAAPQSFFPALKLMCQPAHGKQTDLGKAYQRWEDLRGRLITIA